MNDDVNGLIEFAEKKRLLYGRILHKLGNVNYNEILPAPLITPIIYLTESAFTSLYYEAIDVFDINSESLEIKTTNNFKHKWVGLYTTSLAKESQARGIINNSLQQTSVGEHNSLLSESKDEKNNLIKILYNFNKT